MVTIKRGDRIRRLNFKGNNITPGKEYIATQDDISGTIYLINDINEETWYDSTRFEVIGSGINIGSSNTNNIMTTFKTWYKTKTRQEPEATFVKAGFIDENEELTQDGREALDQLIYQDYKDKLKATAVEFIKSRDGAKHYQMSQKKD